MVGDDGHVPSANRISLGKLRRYGRKKPGDPSDLSTDRTETTRLAAEHFGKASVYRTGRA